MPAAWAAAPVRAATAAAAAAAALITKRSIRRNILSLILFGIAFGFVEAAVVVYLRALSEPLRSAAGYPPGELFPLLSVAQVGRLLGTVKIELAREAATLIMLAAAAGAGARTRRSWLSGFALAFGVWDLAFYAALKVLIDWPQSLMTWDILFLLPVPWSGPVLAPAIVAASLTVGGIVGLLREPPRVGFLSCALLAAGGVILFTSFIWDWRYIAGGGMPRQFPWWIFAVGEGVGVIGFLRAIRR